MESVLGSITPLTSLGVPLHPIAEALKRTIKACGSSDEEFRRTSNVYVLRAKEMVTAAAAINIWKTQVEDIQAYLYLCVDSMKWDQVLVLPLDDAKKFLMQIRDGLHADKDARVRQDMQLAANKLQEDNAALISKLQQDHVRDLEAVNLEAVKKRKTDQIEQTAGPTRTSC